MVGFNLVYFRFSGFYFDYESSVFSGIFLIAWTVVFGYMLGRLYRRYTRLVQLVSLDEGSLRVLLDGRDYTGKARTLAVTSTHRVRAEVAEDASFKQWEAEGGITIDDPRSFETTIEVTGNGTLKALVTKKY